MPDKTDRCVHKRLTFESSSHAAEAGFKRPEQRAAAATTQIIKSGSFEDPSPSTFPAPLVFPDDALSIDPKEPPQSLRSWIRGEWRNKVTPERNVLYLAAPAAFEPELAFAEKWAQPNCVRGKAQGKVQVQLNDVLEYLRAFYHGLEVKLLPSPSPVFTNDVEGVKAYVRPKGKKGPDRQTLWLNTQTDAGCIGVRSRGTPEGEFSHQLNLNDLLDAAIEILPKDAYALLMLVEHDIYEDEEDDFACGRAYGGSRIAVISTARYNPCLDFKQDVEREHAWPASHCTTTVEYYAGSLGNEAPVKKPKVEESSVMSPMQAAIAAHNSMPSLAVAKPSAKALSALWLARVCRTSAHEIGHCFGIGHCVYYACSMQGTASIIEDARQPMYLCPVDLAKILEATGADIKDRYRALLKFCKNKKEGQLFRAHGAWIEARLEELDTVERNNMAG